MSGYTTMDILLPGQSAYVARVEARPDMRRRLMDLGLIPGTRVTCVLHSPSGDPAAYQIRGAVIALRGTDAHEVQIERQESAVALNPAWA